MMDQLFKFIALGMVASSISFGHYAFFYFPLFKVMWLMSM